MLLIKENEQKSFRFNIEVTGTELKNTSARLVFEDALSNKFFPLHINNDGSCEYELDYALVKSLSEGRVYLEVVAESMLFKPWEEEFRIESELPTITVTESVVESKPLMAEAVEEAEQVAPVAQVIKPVARLRKPKLATVFEAKQPKVETETEPVIPMWETILPEFKKIMKTKRASLVMGETKENRSKKKEAIGELYIKYGKEAKPALEQLTRTTIDELLIL
jgi:hypothetical protein